MTGLVIQYCVYSDHEGGNVSAHTGHLVSYLGFLPSILINFCLNQKLCNKNPKIYVPVIKLMNV